MMQLELFNILFFIRCLKDPDTSQEFSIHSFVQFSDCNTRSSSHLKLKHFLSKSTTEGHLFFNRLPRLWNSLPPINLELSISTIKAHLHRLFWMNSYPALTVQIYALITTNVHVQSVLACLYIVHSFSSSQFYIGHQEYLSGAPSVHAFFSSPFPLFVFVLIYSCTVKQI